MSKNRGQAPVDGGEWIVDAGKSTWNATTNHTSGCADRDVSECGGFFLDLISLGGIEGSVSDLSGCADRDLSSCGMLWIDLFTLGLAGGKVFGLGRVCTVESGIASSAPAIGFAEGLGKSALTPGRLQHGTRHLTEKGILPAWSGTKSPAIIERALTPILEHPAATFDHVLGDKPVRGFLGEIDGQQVVIFVYKAGPYQGQLASSVVPSANQLTKWGLN